MAPLSSAMLRVLKAREKVARRNVFFASILYTARLIETDQKPSGVATMFTNGLDIYFHPDFVKENDQYIEGVLLHEVLHCAFNHMGRQQHRKELLISQTGHVVSAWNIACDYAINPLVLSVYKLPKGGLVDSQYDALSAERIYERIVEQAKKNGSVAVMGQNPKGKKGNAPDEQSGRMREATDQEKAEAEKRGMGEDEWRRVVNVAKEKAEKAGQVHGQLKRLIEELFPSDKIDWRRLLDDMARNAKENDNSSWSRPNRRFLGSDIILPGTSQDKVFRLVACIDASGSVSEEYLKEMRAELMSLLEQQIVTHVTLIATDTQVCNKEDVTTPEEVKNFSLGLHGGGTDFQAAMAEVAKIEDAVGCIFLTDMQTSSFGKDPGIPTIWVDWTKLGNQKVPFGQVVSY